MKIGKRERVTNLRDIWPKETDFSDWLVTEDGLSLIAEDIGVEAEEPRREYRPGDFPCDVVAHVLGDEDHIVIIENQFGKTNHDHLGKLLTYTSMNSATTAIWLSEEISDDHRKVIDWLNDNTPAHISFYLAQVKAYRIDDSPVAPQLDVVSRPNLEFKIQKSESDRELKERHVWRKELWQEILGYIKSQKPPFRVQSPGTGAWSDIGIGRGGFHLALTLTPKRQCIGCELYIKVAWREQAFQQLIAQREAIEQEIGTSLQWLLLEGKKSARILLEAPIDPRDDNNRQQVKEWMYQQAMRFYQVFQPRVKNLSAPLSMGSSEAEDLGDEDA